MYFVVNTFHVYYIHHYIYYNMHFLISPVTGISHVYPIYSAC